MRSASGAAALLIVAAAAGVALHAARSDRFPHLEHAGLFPLCAGCHEGISTGVASTFYPPPASCASCHDGGDLPRVEWTPPEPATSNLSFEHPGHADHVRLREEPELDCAACHAEPGAQRMDVRPAAAERCFACHVHEARDHYVDARCATCHIPLAETRFSRGRIATLPEPATHQGTDFLGEAHGELAREATEQCAVCHTRDLCVGCHVDPARYPVITGLPAVPPRMELPPVDAQYPLPASHEGTSWLELHGREARAAEGSCSTCHTRESCTSCHAERAPDAVRALPGRAEVRAPGVSVTRRAPSSHELPLFDRQHGTVAATAATSCTGCHTRTWCEACHTAPAAGREPATRDRTSSSSYHPPNFVARHPAEGWGRTLECSNCHDTQLFCRDCHTQAGMSSTGRLGSAFHDAQPLWLLRHGQAARQGLESCASCHAQRDCLQCHSELGAFRVNPHGPGFDPDRFRTRNRQICFACHLSDPFPGRQP